MAYRRTVRVQEIRRGMKLMLKRITGGVDRCESCSLEDVREDATSEGL